MPKRVIDVDAFLHEHYSNLTYYDPSKGLDEEASCYPNCYRCLADGNICGLEVYAEDLREFAERNSQTAPDDPLRCVTCYWNGYDREDAVWRNCKGCPKRELIQALS